MLRGVTLFDFMVAGPWYGPVLGDHLVGCGVVTNDWCALFRLYVLVICDHRPQSSGDVEDFDFVSAFPNSNHHTVGTAICQNHDSPPPSLLLYCTAMFVYFNRTPTNPPHYGDNVKVKSQHIRQAIPALLKVLGEAGYKWRVHYI